MSLNSATSWSPPYYQMLNLSDCRPAGAFIADWFIAPSLSDMRLDIILLFLRSLDSSYGTGQGPEDWELLQWWDSHLRADSDDTIYYLIGNASLFVQDQCDRQTVCNNVPLEGDPDLAGIGVSLDARVYRDNCSPWRITILTLNTDDDILLPRRCLGYLVCCCDQSQFGQGPPRVPSLDKGLTYPIFKKTLNTFLDTSLLFSISMLLAAIYRLSSAFQHPSRDENTFMYSQLNAVTVSMFSVLLPLLLQFPGQRLRRKRIRAILWFLVISFVTTLTVLYHQWRGHDPISKHFEDNTILNMFEDHADQVLWLSACDLNNKSLLDALDCAIIITQVVLFLNLPRWIYLLFNILSAPQKGSRIPQRHINNGLYRILSNWKRTYRWVRLLNILVCCATMWLLLSIFTAITIHLAEAMGQWSKDRQWSVGQVLAMATFAPLIIDIIAICLSDPTRALEGKLPWGLRVVERKQSAEMIDVKDLRRHTFHNTGNSSEYEVIGDGAGSQTA